MAAILKCTKLNNTGLPGASAGTIAVVVSYVDPTTAPPTPGIITISVPKADLEDDTALKSDIDTDMGSALGTTIDWTL